MGLLEGIVLVLAAAAVAALGWCAKKVSDHDGNDRELAAKVDGTNQRLDGLDKRLDRFESYVMNELTEIKTLLRGISA